MRKKERKFLASFTAVALAMSMLCGSMLSASAEGADTDAAPAASPAAVQQQDEPAGEAEEPALATQTEPETTPAQGEGAAEETEEPAPAEPASPAVDADPQQSNDGEDLKQFSDEVVLSAPVSLFSVQDDKDNANVTAYADNVVIVDKIKENGTIVPSITDSTGAYTYTWEKQTSANGEWESVNREKKTASYYNVAEDGSWLNVAVDNVNADVPAIAYQVIVKNGNGEIVSQAVYSVAYYDELKNGSFEATEPEQSTPNGTNGLIWKTTASDGMIEIVKANSLTNSGFSITTAEKDQKIASGNQFAELNANEYGALYQDVLTLPGATLNWQLYHTARLSISLNDRFSGSDVMYVLIMSAEKAEQMNIQSTQDLRAVVNAVKSGNDTVTINGKAIDLAGVTARRIEDGGTWSREGLQRWYKDSENDSQHNYSGDWHKWTGDYTVPTDQFLTRFFFVSYTCAYDNNKYDDSKNATVGNLLDGVLFTTKPLPPDPDKGNLTVTKTVVGLNDLPENYAVIIRIDNDNGYEFKKSNFTKMGEGWSASYTFQNIAAGEYTVKESASNVEGYDVVSRPAQSVSIGDRETKTVSFTNTYTPSTGTLNITKMVMGLSSDDKIKPEQFSFEIIGEDGKQVETITLPTKSGDGYVLTASLTLTPGTYTVTESGADIKGYRVATTSDPEDGKVEVRAGNTVNITFTNTYTDTSDEYPVRFYLEGIRSSDGKNYPFKDNWGELQSILSSGYAALTAANQAAQSGLLPTTDIGQGITGDRTVRDWMVAKGIESNLNTTTVSTTLDSLVQDERITENTVVTSVGGVSYTVKNVIDDPDDFAIVYTQATNNQDRLKEYYNGNYIKDSDGAYWQKSYHVHLRVVRNPGTLVVTKTFSGIEALPNDFNISVYDGQTLIKTLKVANATESDTNTYTWTLENLSAATYTVTESGADVDGMLMDHKVAIGSDNAQNAQTIQATVIKSETTTANFTNTYTQPTLTISKSVAGNMGDTGKAFKFTLTLKDKDSKPYTQGLVGESETSLPADTKLVNNGDGTYTFYLTNQGKLVLKLPAGITYTVTEDKEEYSVTVSAPDKVTVNGEKASGILNADTEIAYTNTKEIVPPTGLSSNTAPYLIMVGVALAAGAWMLLRRRREVE